MATCLEKITHTLSTYYIAWQCMNKQNNPEKITAVQNKKLRNLTRFCYENIKYYKELFDEHHIGPNEIKTTSDLIKIPILTKDQLRNRFWDFLPKELPRCRISRTSGSTGIPVCILSDIKSRLNNSAAVIRYRRALGMPMIGRPILTPLKTENDPNRAPHWTFLQGIHRTYYINPYINNTEFEKKRLRKLRKPILIGITPAIRAFAYKIRDGLLPSIEPSAVLTTGEYLTHNVRGLLESTFRIKVTDIYACNEAGDIAWQCREGQLYHINADNCIVEILKNGKPVERGQAGEVVITNLNRYAMPFIRYKNGDIAKFSTEECSCDCKLPAISEIIGRTGEDIYLPNGKMIPWNQLKSHMNHPHIRQFQLIQTEDGSLSVKYVPENDSSNSRIEDLLLARYRKLLGNTVKIEIQRTNIIPLAKSGKSKLVISNYKPIISQS